MNMISNDNDLFMAIKAIPNIVKKIFVHFEESAPALVPRASPRHLVPTSPRGSPRVTGTINFHRKYYVTNNKL